MRDEMEELLRAGRKKGAHLSHAIRPLEIPWANLNHASCALALGVGPLEEEETPLKIPWANLNHAGPGQKTSLRM